MGAATLLQDLYNKLIGTGDLGTFTGSATGSLGEQLAYLQSLVAGRQVPLRSQVPNLSAWISSLQIAGTNTWPAANDAIFVPFELDQQQTLNKIHLRVITQAGNLDVGIYPSTGGAKIITQGATAVAAAGLQTIDISNTVLAKGRYLFAMSCDTSTVAFQMVEHTGVNPAGLDQLGFTKQATAYPLPASATLAAPTAGRAPYAVLEWL